jgi:hypothetical protein
MACWKRVAASVVVATLTPAPQRAHFQEAANSLRRASTEEASATELLATVPMETGLGPLSLRAEEPSELERSPSSRGCPRPRPRPRSMKAQRETRCAACHHWPPLCTSALCGYDADERSHRLVAGIARMLRARAPTNWLSCVPNTDDCGPDDTARTLDHTVSDAHPKSSCFGNLCSTEAAGQAACTTQTQRQSTLS